MRTPILPCQRCGVVDLPRVEPGTGPHVAKALCAHCHTFIKWLPKMKETPMHASINRVTLMGQISKYGMEVRYNASGTPCASFTIIVNEMGQDGKEHATYIPCECWGKKAEAAGELEAGQLVLLEGKLRKRQKGDSWELIVSGFEVQPMVLGSMVTEAAV
jgi:hypothetical protein